MTKSHEIIFGTGNQAKIQQLQSALDGLNIKVTSIKEIGAELPEVEEDGTTVVENARKKAVAYASAIDRTVFSMDNALYFNGVDDQDQPGLLVRRINGIDAANDDEMVYRYTEFLKDHGGTMKGWWEYGLSIAWPDGTSVEEVIKSPRQFVDRPSQTVIPGYPLESIQIDPETGRYISEMTDKQRVKFWQDTIGKALKDFVNSNL